MTSDETPTGIRIDTSLLGFAADYAADVRRLRIRKTTTDTTGLRVHPIVERAKFLQPTNRQAQHRRQYGGLVDRPYREIVSSTLECPAQRQTVRRPKPACIARQKTARREARRLA